MSMVLESCRSRHSKVSSRLPISLALELKFPLCSHNAIQKAFERLLGLFIYLGKVVERENCSIIRGKVFFTFHCQNQMSLNRSPPLDQSSPRKSSHLKGAKKNKYKELNSSLGLLVGPKGTGMRCWKGADGPCQSL